MSLPFGPPLKPMLSATAAGIPVDGDWLYEPKWDGFRALAFVGHGELYLQSRDLKPLLRYFPELDALLDTVSAAVLDGEIVIMTDRGLDFGALQQRLHPAAFRVQKLAAETPATFVAFDLLAIGSEDLRDRPFEERHGRLLTLFEDSERLIHTPATTDAALAADWFMRFEGAGFDGIIAKRLDQPYQPDVRAMLKVKHVRTADCVVAGFRWGTGQPGTSVGSLLLGLNDAAGVLHHVGHTSSFSAADKRALVQVLAPLVTEDSSTGFGQGRTPGAPSRWTRGRESDWMRVRPELVCEVAYDHLQGDRFRHGTTFRRWRPDKAPEACRYDQLQTVVPTELQAVLGH